MAAPSAGILDAFSEADGSAPPSASWTRLQAATADLTVVAATGRVKLPSGTNTANYWNASTFGPNSEVYVTVPVLAVASSIVLYLRLQGTPSSSRDGYGLVYQHGSPGTFTIRRYTSSVGTTLVGPTNTTISAGQKLWFSAVGNILTAYYYNGTAWVSVNSYDITPDATKYTTAGYVAVGISDTTVRLDDFGGGATSSTVTGASTTTLSLNIASVGVRTRLGVSATTLALNIASIGKHTATGVSTSTYTLNIASLGVRTRFGISAVPLTLNIASVGTRTRFGSSTVPLNLNIASAGAHTGMGAASLGLLLGIASAGTRGKLGVSASTYAFNIASSGLQGKFGAASLPLLLSIFSDATLGQFGSASLTETLTFGSQGIRATAGQSSMQILFGLNSAGHLVEVGSASMTVVVGIDSEGGIFFVFPDGPAGSLASPHAGSIAGSRNGRIAQPLAGTLN